MKKGIIALIVIGLTGAVVFIGIRFLTVNTKTSVVDPRKYLGNLAHPAQIYTTSSSGQLYCPMNIELVAMDKLMLMDIADDPEYETIELQTFDDARGRGARVLLYPHKGPAASYFTDKKFETKESEHDTPYIAPDIKYHLAVTPSGLNASLKMLDHNGKSIEFQVTETGRKNWSKGFLAPIGDSEAITFEYFPFFFMKQMNFVLRSGTEIAIKIDGQKRTPKKLPIPANWEFVYLTRYTPAPVFACWNKPRKGQLHPLHPKGQSVYTEKNTTYELVHHNGHPEIHAMTGFDETHAVRIDFAPAIPDLVAINDGTDVEGRFCIGADGVVGIVAGTYRINRRGNIINMHIRPQEGWQPTPGALWVKRWIWKSTLEVATDETVSMESAWIREP